MEFWGVEVESGQPFKVIVGEGKVLRLSQATLGEIKKETKEYVVVLRITQNEKKLVLGTLNSERLPQQQFDVVFDKDFQISHNYKNGSVFFYGYTDENHVNDYDGFEDEEVELSVPVPDDASISEDFDDDEDNVGSSDDEEDSDEEEETPTPKKQSGKKRPNESVFATPGTDKKAKSNTATPHKTEGKKGGAVHIATPHPSKQAVAKTPAGGSKSNQKSSPADGAYSCKGCNRKFKREGALSSHN